MDKNGVTSMWSIKPQKWRILILGILFCICDSLKAAPTAQSVLSPFREVKLPYSIVSRSVQGLVIGEDGLLHGASFGKDPWLFTYDPGQAKIIASRNLFQNQPRERSFPYGSLATLAGNKFAVSYMSPMEGRKYGLGGVVASQYVKPTAPMDTGFRWIMSGSSNFVALVGDPRAPLLYGLNATGHILRYEIQEKTIGKAQILGRVWTGLQPDAERDNLPRVLILDTEGNVYTTGEKGFIFRGSAEEKIILDNVARAPAEPGREECASLDSAVLGPDGLIYGGTFDGYVFTFNPKTNEVINIGKPLREGRIQGLAFSKGKLIGVGGEKGPPQIFAWDPKTQSFELGGSLQAADGKPITETVGAMVADKNGNVYLGTTGQQGNLYVWEARLAKLRS